MSEREQRFPRQVVVRLPEAMIEELKRRAKANDRTVAQEVRRAVREYLEAQS